MNNKMKTILQVIARILLLLIIIFVFYCTISMNREIVLDTKYEYVAVEGVVNVEPENKFDVVTQSYSNDKERYFTYLNYNGKRYCIEGEKYYNYCITKDSVKAKIVTYTYSKDAEQQYEKITNIIMEE